MLLTLPKAISCGFQALRAMISMLRSLCLTLCLSAANRTTPKEKFPLAFESLRIDSSCAANDTAFDVVRLSYLAASFAPPRSHTRL
jgi:hypothetical protein